MYYTNADVIMEKATGALFVVFQGKMFQIGDPTIESRARNYQYSKFTKVGDLREIGYRAKQDEEKTWAHGGLV